MAHRIVIEPTTIRGDRGQRYRVYFQDAVLIEDTWNPEFEACRALVERGVTGRLEVWRADKPGKAETGIPVSAWAKEVAPYPGLIVPDIARAAGRTVVENEKIGPVMAPWRAWPEDMQPDGVPRDTVFAPAAVSLEGVA